MLIYRNAEGVHGQRKFGNTCAKVLYLVTCVVPIVAGASNP